MVKRTDQEIAAIQAEKNRTQEIYQINQAIQNLKFGLDGIRKDLEKHQADVARNAVYKEIAFENLQQLVNLSIQKCHQSLDEHLDTFNKIRAEIKVIKEKLDSEHVKVSAYNVDKSLILSAQDNLRDTVNRLYSKIESECKSITDNLLQKISCVKTEVFEKPSEITQATKNIEDRIGIIDVNASGCAQELDRLKRSLFVAQKHIEDLYLKMDKKVRLT